MGPNDVLIAGQAAVISEYQNATASQAEAYAIQRGNDEATINRQNQSIHSINLELARLKKKVEDQDEQENKYIKIINERDALILEWMMSNEVHRRLADQFQNQLGLTKLEINKMKKQAAEEIITEKPELRKTEYLTKIRNLSI